MRLKAHDPRNKHIKLDTLLTEHGSAGPARTNVSVVYPGRESYEFGVRGNGTAHRYRGRRRHREPYAEATSSRPRETSLGHFEAVKNASVQQQAYRTPIPACHEHAS